MGNSPVNGVDPDGGCTVGVDCPKEFDYMGEGTWVMDEVVLGSNGSFDMGVLWGSDSMGGGGLLDFSLASASTWQDIQGRFGEIPYQINKNFSFDKYGRGSGYTGWGKVGSSFTPKANGGSQDIYGTLELNARVSYSDGNFSLDIDGFALTQNHPGNNISTFLNVTYSNNKSRSITFDRNAHLPMLIPQGVSHLGGLTFALPVDPNNLSQLDFTIGHWRRTPTGPISHSLRGNLLKVIRNR